MSTDDKGLVEQALDVLVYAPLGLALEARDLLPKLAERGRGQVTLTRLAGRYATEQAKREAAKVVDATTTTTRAGTGSTETLDDLPIEDYDDLSAPQILPRLEQLETSELEGVLDYEQHHRARATVINRIRQLQS